MTALPISPDERFSAIPCERINEALEGWEDPEVLLINLDCMGTAVPVRLPLFHTDGPSTDPRNVNWGEVSRVFAPGSPQMKYLYGGRNDTESRHDDLKARVKHLPRDVRGQEFRLLGAAMAINAAAWQIHLQAHGERNVIDDTA